MFKKRGQLYMPWAPKIADTSRKTFLKRFFEKLLESAPQGRRRLQSFFPKKNYFPNFANCLTTALTAFGTGHLAPPLSAFGAGPLTTASAPSAAATWLLPSAKNIEKQLVEKTWSEKSGRKNWSKFCRNFVDRKQLVDFLFFFVETIDRYK